MTTKVKRKLTKISFDFDKAHLAYTSADFPACSMMDDPILLKSLEQGKELTIEQQSLLESIGYDISEVSKSTEMEGSEKPSTTSEVISGDGSEAVTQNLNKGNDIMSEALLKDQETRIEALEKQLKVSQAENALTKYDLEADLKKELSTVLMDADSRAVVLKAFDAFVSSGAEALEKAVAAAPQENALQKELSQEVGEAGEVEKPVEKSRSEKIAAYLPKAKTNGEEI